MGSGSYSYIDSSVRASYRAESLSSLSAAEAMETTFTRRSIDPDMVIKGKIRESRDSVEHPESFPIIIALDTTGSMGTIPMDLIKGAFPEIMKNILDTGIADPQVCFIGVGDCYCDDGPIQCGQFESSDELMEKWFQKVWLEGGGGSNPGESYNLAWYFAARHTVTDSWEKRHKKGVLITIGDEPCLAEIPHSDICNLFDSTAQAGITSKAILHEAMEKWEPYHIQIGEPTEEGFFTKYSAAIAKWEKLIGKERLIVLPRTNYNIITAISSIILNVYGGNKPAKVSKEAEKKEPKIML